MQQSMVTGHTSALRASTAHQTTQGGGREILSFGATGGLERFFLAGRRKVEVPVYPCSFVSVEAD
jgi:hypothetical protein